MAPSAPWRDLPPELLSSVAHRLIDLVDYVRFRSVCKPWRSVVGPADLPPVLPWLMLPSAPRSASRRFNLAMRTVHDVDLPEAIDQAICGSLNQYIIMLNRSTLQVTLLNPFNRTQITNLLPLRPFREVCGQRLGRMLIGWISHSLHSYAWNIIFPATEEIMVVFTISALSRSSFVYCRTGNKVWTEVDSILALIQGTAYHRGKFYVVGQDRSPPVVGEKSISIPEMVMAAAR